MSTSLPTSEFIHGSPSASGFSLIEILVALTLVGVIIYSIDFSLTGNSDDIESCVNSFERASRFASHEAILRGAMVRLHLSLDKNPQEWVLEAAPDGDFILPLFDKYENDDKLSLEEKAQKDKLIKDVNNKFSKISEFQEDVATIPVNIKILGVATNARSVFIQEGEAAIYFYPNGERDAALMVFASPGEMFSLMIDPFTDGLRKEFLSLDKKKSEDLQIDEMESKAKEIYEKWVKN
ncbi:MAG: prepilin-type N-terminal cleavage/methylation domain-containing protein [Oligoflexia bacterium]|nr:prepilin-type N-terminal cleavage/methylation domain-containing protein [Oligoflexia bacterium]